MTAYLILAAPVVLLIAVAAAPFVMEALRKPMGPDARGRAQGEIAHLDSGETHYRWHGPRSDRVIVLVPGLTSPSWIFDALIGELLRLDYRVLSYDLYGRGLSDRVAGAQTLDFHARQLGELLQVLGAKGPVTLLGYSMGGAIATRFAAAESDIVDRLVLVAPAGMGYRPAALLTRAARAGIAGSWLWGLLGPAALRRAAAADAKKPGGISDVKARIETELGRRGYLAAVLSSERNALKESVASDHHEIAAMYIPTLAIWGEADDTIPISGVGQLASWNRQAHQEVIAGADHALIVTEADQVAETLRVFLHDVPA